MKRIAILTVLLMLVAPAAWAASAAMVAGASGYVAAAADTTKPAFASASIGSTGTALTVNWTEASNNTATGGGWNVSQMTVTGCTSDSTIGVASVTSGSGTNTWVLALDTTVQQADADTCKLNFDGGSTSIVDPSGNYVDDFSNQSITNNSTQGAAIAYVNSGNATASGGGVATLAASAFSATTGNAIVVGAACWNSGGAQNISGVADTAGNSYARCGSIYSEGANSRMEIWVAYNVTGNAANVVTATWAAAVGDRRIVALQYSGMLASGSPCDADFDPAGVYDSASPYTSTADTTAVNGEMVVGMFYSDAALTYTNGTATTKRVSGDDYAGADNLVASAGSASVSLASAAGQPTTIIARAFKPQ
jgi:hypothetical protein